MATLTVRNLDDDVVRRFRIRAAENGVSTEAEHRAILRRTLLEAGVVGLERQRIAELLAAFRERTADRGSPWAIDLLAEARSERMRKLSGGTNGTCLQ